MTSVATFDLSSTPEDAETLCREIVANTFGMLLTRVQDLRVKEAILSKRVKEEVVAPLDPHLLHATEAREHQLALLVFHICNDKVCRSCAKRVEELHEDVWKANTRLQSMLRRQRQRARGSPHDSATTTRSFGTGFRETAGLTSSGGDASGPTSPISWKRAKPARKPALVDARNQTNNDVESDTDSVDSMMADFLHERETLTNAKVVRIPSKGRKQPGPLDGYTNIQFGDGDIPGTHIPDTQDYL